MAEAPRPRSVSGSASLPPAWLPLSEITGGGAMGGGGRKWDVKMGFWFWMDAEGHAGMGQAGTRARVQPCPVVRQMPRAS